ncbi:MAG TPA: lysophospholipid acyltransferase family protein [Lacibacter sp.]|nr:lysophospholipid acyltransferase family protein [Lacibacter sp.]HMO88316.1 lysophospholipid acyltransferase family protein [Lacibacter sp.]
MIGWLLSLWFRFSGWKITGRFPHEVPKMVIAVGPHTSGWDVVVGLSARHLIPIDHAYFLGKKELFDGPFGWFFRSLGGTPVDRFSSTGMVQQVAQKFADHDQFRLAMSPEGTRKRVDKLRTGFYYIAKEAGVPILLSGFDFAKKEVVLGPLIYPSADEEADFARILSFFAAVQGKYPEQGLGHLASSPSARQS